MIRLIIADDHTIIRGGLKIMLAEATQQIQIVGEAASGKELLELLAHTEADVVLMDIQMPEMDGLETTSYISQHFPHLKVLVLSMLEQQKYAIDALNAGALGYILKTTSQEELLYAIGAVARGEKFICTEIALHLLNTLHPLVPPSSPANAPFTRAFSQEKTDTLSKRELEVLRLIAQGYTNAEIAEKLYTSKRTIESHRQSLLEKTGSKNTASLILYASKHLLLDEGRAPAASSHVED